jgi:hypothetical protein
MEKLCKQCFERLPLDKFNGDGKGKYYICKDCKSANSKVQYQMRKYPDQKDFLRYGLLVKKYQNIKEKKVLNRSSKVQEKIDKLRILETPKFDVSDVSEAEEQSLYDTFINQLLLLFHDELNEPHNRTDFIYSSDHTLIIVRGSDDKKWNSVKRLYKKKFPSGSNVSK